MLMFHFPFPPRPQPSTLGLRGGSWGGGLGQNVDLAQMALICLLYANGLPRTIFCPFRLEEKEQKSALQSADIYFLRTVVMQFARLRSAEWQACEDKQLISIATTAIAFTSCNAAQQSGLKLIVDVSFSFSTAAPTIHPWP